jgi:hypothetical protein
MNKKLDEIFGAIVDQVETTISAKQGIIVKYCLISILSRLEHIQYHLSEVKRNYNFIIKERGSI